MSFFMCESDIFNGPHCKVQCEGCRPMPTAPDDPLRKVTLNLYATDCEFLERTYGRGWTERVRQHIHAEVLTRQDFQQKHLQPIRSVSLTRRTLGDL